MSEFMMSILYIVVGLVIGGLLGWYFTQRYINKQLKENPPINEKMIRAMYMQMGRKPSEKQIKQTMKAINDQK
ncbi:MAG: YneF family protein [Erysipelothrix sp.]|nr:YneF family protein [Erysipelothrix sp.]